MACTISTPGKSDYRTNTGPVLDHPLPKPRRYGVRFAGQLGGSGAGKTFAAAPGAGDFSFLTDANAASSDFSALAPLLGGAGAASSGATGSGSGVNPGDVLKLSTAATSAFSGVDSIADAIAAQSSTTGILGNQIIGQEAGQRRAFSGRYSRSSVISSA